MKSLFSFLMMITFAYEASAMTTNARIYRAQTNGMFPAALFRITAEIPCWARNSKLVTTKTGMNSYSMAVEYSHKPQGAMVCLGLALIDFETTISAEIFPEIQLVNAGDVTLEFNHGLQPIDQPVVSEVYVANLTRVNIDPNLNDNSIVGGTISIDKTENTVTLELERVFRCPPQAICPMVVKQLPPRIVTLPIVSTEMGACNSRTIVAEVNYLMANGHRETIQVTDNSKFSCPTFAKVIPTVIAWDFYPGFSLELGAPHLPSHSTLWAEKLKLKK